jgi:hypothetical protein
MKRQITQTLLSGSCSHARKGHIWWIKLKLRFRDGVIHPVLDKKAHIDVVFSIDPVGLIKGLML